MDFKAVQRECAIIISKAAKFYGVDIPTAPEMEDIISLIVKYYGRISPVWLMRCVETSAMRPTDDVKVYGKITAEWFGRLIKAWIRTL